MPARVEAYFLPVCVRSMKTQWWKLALWAYAGTLVCALPAQQRMPFSVQSPQQRSRSFLSQRGMYMQSPARMLAHARAQSASVRANGAPAAGFTASWASVGPSAIQTSAYGAVSGRVTSIAVDPSDTSGNIVYVGTTGGGVWKSTNAAGTSGSVTFTPLTDTLPASKNCQTPAIASLSIGALTVQPGGTGVVLAGTGDPNDATDSYYGEGVLRSTDGGQTWCTITQAADHLAGTYSFVGEGFAGFAWSTQNTSLVVAAVAGSLEGAMVNAESPSVGSFAGIYYSQDAGATWHLATITDGTGMEIQGPDRFPVGTGNSATSVTWNPVRNRFYAAVRYHGYYESTDGVTWTRLQNQPGTGLYQAQCPANPGSSGGSLQCPIFRGTIVSQPVTGDLFAITIDNNNMDQGLWRDVCNANNGSCSSSTVTFSQQIADTPIESAGKIPQGDYALSLAAVPAQQDTLLFVGAKDLYQCSLLNNCVWRNTTNAGGCAAAQVAPSQHAIDATLGASGMMYFGNDGGLWRTTDAVNQQKQVCSSDDAAHFQNLNGNLGPVSEVSAFSVDPQNANIMMAALGAFGTAALTGSGSTWTQVLAGEGDNNAMDPQNSQNWYATAAPAGSNPFIESCASGSGCTSASSWSAAIGSAQIANDVAGPAVPWILDPQNTANIIIGTCRIWRGLANGQSWTQGNLLSNSLDTDQQTSDCNGNAQIRSLAASGGSGNTEKIYAGMAGWADGGASIAGHLYSATVPASGGLATWNDLSSSPIINGQRVTFNAGGFDISSIYVDPHDPTGNTVYVTQQGFITLGVNGALVYRSLDGGAHWIAVADNLPDVPANSILVDPDDANTVYVATDMGVWATRDITSCIDTSSSCWTKLGSGLPFAPVTQLRYVSSGSTKVLLASTYGRGIWQIPLLSSSAQSTTATLTPIALLFSGQTQNTTSSPQTITVTNTGSISLAVTSITASQSFAETDTCLQQPIAPAQSCEIQVTFTPQQTGAIQGTLIVYGNLPGGQLTATLSGSGLAPGTLVVTPGSLSFGSVMVSTTSTTQDISIANTGGVSMNLQPPSISGDFQIIANTCGTSLPPNFACAVRIAFTPTASGARSGTFSISNGTSTQVVLLSGNGQTQATAQLSTTNLNFATPVTVGNQSSPQTVTLTNTGDATLAQISVVPSGDFLAQNNCSGLLPGHASCAIVVTFAPKQAGAESGNLSIGTAIGTQVVALSGTGVAPAGVTLLPTSVDFGGQGVNITSSKQRITLSNNGGVALTGLAFAITGDFAIADNSCASEGTLPVGSACTLDVAFTPTQTQSRTGTLTVSAGQLPVPYSVPLKGTGEDFTIAVTGQSSQVIVNGQSAAYTVQIASVNGSSGPVQIACSGLPQNATCTSGLAAGATLSGTATLTATVTIATGTGTNAALRWPRMTTLAFAFLPCLCFISRSRKNLLRLWLFCILSVTLLASTACGVSASGGSGSGSGTPPSGSTPSSTYTININATLDGLTKTVPVQLTVQ